jgi:hypothetical protein
MRLANFVAADSSGRIIIIKRQIAFGQAHPTSTMAVAVAAG